jgi:sugar/nucleoside kinase (ribokinase family)
MPVEDALVVASATAGLTCTRRGAVDAMPAGEEVVALMERHDRRLRVSWPSGWAR